MEMFESIFQARPNLWSTSGGKAAWRFS